MALSPQGRQPVFGGLDDDDDDEDRRSSDVRPRRHYREDYNSGLQEYASDSHSLDSSLTCSVEGSSGDEDSDSDYDESDEEDNDYGCQGYQGSINALGYHKDGGDEQEQIRQVSVNALGYHLEEPSLHTDSRRRSSRDRRTSGGDRRYSGGHGPRRVSMDLIKGIAFPWGRKEPEGPPKEVALVTRAPRRMSTGGSVPVRARAPPTQPAAKKAPKKVIGRRGSLLGLMPVKNLPSLPIASIFGRDSENAKKKREADAFAKVADELFG